MWVIFKEADETVQQKKPLSTAYFSFILFYFISFLSTFFVHPKAGEKNRNISVCKCVLGHLHENNKEKTSQIGSFLVCVYMVICMCSKTARQMQ